MASRFRRFESAFAAVFCMLMPTFGGESISLYWENDVVFVTDRYYTQGTRLQYSQWGRTDNISIFSDDIPLLFCDGTASKREYWIQQLMYTPENIKIAEPQMGSRPWCGILTAGYRETKGSPTLADSFEIQLGAVGPESYAEETQEWFHDVTGSRPPAGWGNQIDTVYGGTAIRSRHWRPWSVGSDMKCDATFSGSAALGNFFTYAEAGAVARAGMRPPDDLGEIFIGPRVPDRWSAYVLGGIKGRAVARNIALDGDTIGYDSDTEKRPLVGDAFAGFGARLMGADLTFIYTWRTDEFYGQKYDNGFGSLSLSAIF